MIDGAWDFDSIGGSVTTTEEALANPAAINAAVQQVLKESVGDAPVITPPEDDLVKLPGGLYWEGDLLRTAQVRELTGEDEEALARVRGSLARWLSVLLERTVVRVGDEPVSSKMLKRMLIGDRDELVIGVRIATFGKHITAHRVQCPHCEEYFDATVDLTQVERARLEEPKPGHQYEVELRSGRTAVVRLPDGEAQEAIFEEDDATVPERNSVLLGHCVLRVDGDESFAGLTGKELAKRLSMADRRTLIKFLSETQPGPLLDDIRFDHEGCGKEVRLTLDMPELFRGE